MPRSQSAEHYASPDLAHALALFYAGTCEEGLPRSRWRPYVSPIEPDSAACRDLAEMNRGSVYFNHAVGPCWHPECDLPAAYRFSERFQFGDIGTLPGVPLFRNELGHVFCSEEHRANLGTIRRRALAAFGGWCISDLPIETGRMAAEVETLRMALNATTAGRSEAVEALERVTAERDSLRQQKRTLSRVVEVLQAAVTDATADNSPEEAHA
jgi:hypothetical protein